MLGIGMPFRLCIRYLLIFLNPSFIGNILFPIQPSSLSPSIWLSIITIFNPMNLQPDQRCLWLNLCYPFLSTYLALTKSGTGFFFSNCCRIKDKAMEFFPAPFYHTGIVHEIGMELKKIVDHKQVIKYC